MKIQGKRRQPAEGNLKDGGVCSPRRRQHQQELITSRLLSDAIKVWRASRPDARRAYEIPAPSESQSKLAALNACRGSCVFGSNRRFGTKRGSKPIMDTHNLNGSILFKGSPAVSAWKPRLQMRSISG